MISLLRCSNRINDHLRYVLCKNNSIFKSIKNQTNLRNYQKRWKNEKSPKFTLSSLTKIGFTLTSGGIIKLVINNHKVLCEEQKTRLKGYKKSNKEQKFDWERFWCYLYPHLWYLGAAIIGALAVAFLNILIPKVMGNLIDLITKLSDTNDSTQFLKDMKRPIVKMIVLYVTQSLCTFFYIYMLSNLGEKLAYQMKTDLFASILKQDIAFFDQQRTGEVINRLTTDIQDFKSSFKQIVSGGLRASAQIIGSSVTLIMISPHMTFVTLLCIPTVITLGTIFGSLLRHISRKAQDQMEKTTAVADEAINNIRTVRAFAMEDQELELYSNEAEVAMILNENLGFGIGWFQAGTNLFLNSMVLATLYMGGYLLSSNQLSAGDVMSFLMSSQTIQRSLAQISLLFGSVIKGLAAGGRIFEYMNTKPGMLLKGGLIIPIDHIKGEIDFRNVTFSYPTRSQTVLKDFNLKIPAGKTIAIVGASGNGKSTIVALIERFYDIKNGAIMFDDHDIRTLDPSWLRTKVLGLISQEPILFYTSIMENIRYGRPDATDEEVKEAAQLANADDFITTFPQGYETVVGERGATLSGGQKQRIAIARALLKKPRVLLLDEATSALDSESEKIVQAALDKAREGRTVVVIAHRLSTVKNADLIVVLHKGTIVEMGTHESLLQLKGYYWSMVYQQQAVPTLAG